MQVLASHHAKIAAALAIPPTMATPDAIRYATINQASELRPAFTPAALRDLKFKSANRFNSRGETISGNGSAEFGVWIAIGRKVLVDLVAFDRWIASHKVGVVQK